MSLFENYKEALPYKLFNELSALSGCSQLYLYTLCIKTNHEVEDLQDQEAFQKVDQEEVLLHLVEGATEEDSGVVLEEVHHLVDNEDDQEDEEDDSKVLTSMYQNLLTKQ